MTLAREDNVRCDVAVVVPAFNEAESLPELVERIAGAVDAMGLTWEAWIIDDGSTDGTFAVVERLARERPQVHGLCFGRNFGKAAALAAGFEAADATVVITMDADLQDDPAEIPDLIAKLEEGWDLVSGWKQDRKDSFIKNNTSKVFNWFTGRMCGLRLHDFNCGLKGYRREVTRRVKLYGDMHRYVPALAHLDGFRVTEKPVRHFARKYGTTKYGMARFVNGFLDLLTVYFLHARRTSPLHMFGRIGLGFLGAGGLICAYFLGLWLLGHGLRLRPALLLGLVFIIVAFQMISLGLIAELVVAGRRPESAFRVARRV
ncbi:MAG TPA: glycosyltransferase family 2 protein [Candidatus Krumholzibacteria bacterium]|nr:glycosyltransferase family 2 protein [Candidatus Krumholzibacteria bacterium]